MWDCVKCRCQAIAASLLHCPVCREERDVPKTTANDGASNGWAEPEPEAVAPEAAEPEPELEPEVAAPAVTAKLPTFPPATATVVAKPAAKPAED